MNARIMRDSTMLKEYGVDAAQLPIGAMDAQHIVDNLFFSNVHK